MSQVLPDDVIIASVDAASVKLLTQLQVADESITGIHFFQGNPREIVNELKELSESTPEFQKKRYPAVFLFRDFREVMNPMPGIYSEAKVRLFIVTLTDPTYDSQQRKAISFLPILYPIYHELLYQLEVSGKLMIGDEFKSVNKIDHYFWGREGVFSKDENFFTDWIDCIEIEELNLLTYINKC